MTPPKHRALRAILLAGLLALFVFAVPVNAFAIGPNAMIYPTGWKNNAVTRGDDNTYPTVNLPFSMTWNGTTYTNVNINMNGNATFGAAYTAYNPNVPLTSTGQNIMAPFWADVDTRNTSVVGTGPAGLCYYSDAASSTACVVKVGSVDHKAFIVTWQGVAPYNSQASPLNWFQLVIVERSDTGAGNFDFWFNYDQMNWDFPTASSTGYPHAGWAFASGGTGYELPGGGTSGALIDGGPYALVNGTLNANGQLGRYIFTVRGGQLPNVPPNIAMGFKNKTLEANSPSGYVGYNSATDATATDGDGTIASFTRNPVAGTVLPYGSTLVTWTATDNDGATTVATQTITVVDTTPPSLPFLWSPSHVASQWSAVATMVANWSTSEDAGSGLGGYSYSWSRDATALPDATTETVSYNAVLASTTPVDVENFDAAAWPADWVQGGANPTYARISTTRFHNAANAAEVYANSTTRRTATFTKTFDLSQYDTANLTFWDYRTALSTNADYEQVRYSLDGGTTWTNVVNTPGGSAPGNALQGWTQKSSSLPTASSVMIQFGASVNATTEYVDWDEISVTGTVATPNYTSAAPGDGRWYFNLRAVDTRGNWNPAATSIGPFWIESFPPISTSNVPSGWTSSTPNVSITATDAGSGVAYTNYKYDASAWTTYTAAFAPGVDGTHTLLFYSVDGVGHKETTRTATLQRDTVAPSVPASIGASALTTKSVEVTWNASTDAISGVAYYAIYRNSSLIATVPVGTLTYTDTGLVPGSIYPYDIAAIDAAGNKSADSVIASVTLPSAAIWMSMSTNSVDFGGVSPGLTSTIASATTVKVGGVGFVQYDFSCSATNFSNSTTSSITPTMPVSMLSYATTGFKTTALQPFSTTPQMIDTSIGAKYVWQHDYRFDYVLNVPWAFEPGTYTTNITYTVVER